MQRLFFYFYFTFCKLRKTANNRLNLRYYEIHNKLRLLIRSFQILPLHLTAYDRRAIHIYPRSVGDLHRCYADLRTQSAELTCAAKALGTRLFYNLNTIKKTSNNCDSSIWERLLKSICRRTDTLLDKIPKTKTIETDLVDCFALINTAATLADRERESVFPIKLKAFYEYLKVRYDKMQQAETMHMVNIPTTKTSITIINESPQQEFSVLFPINVLFPMRCVQLPSRKHFYSGQPLLPISLFGSTLNCRLSMRTTSSTSTKSSCTSLLSNNDNNDVNSETTAETSPAMSTDLKSAPVSLAGLDNAVNALSLKCDYSSFSLKTEPCFDADDEEATFSGGLTDFATPDVDPTTLVSKPKKVSHATSTQKTSSTISAFDFLPDSISQHSLPSLKNTSRSQIRCYNQQEESSRVIPVTERQSSLHFFDTDNLKEYEVNNSTSKEVKMTYNALSSFMIYQNLEQLDDGSLGPGPQAPPTPPLHNHSPKSFSKRSRNFSYNVRSDTDRFVFDETLTNNIALLPDHESKDLVPFVQSPAGKLQKKKKKYS